LHVQFRVTEIRERATDRESNKNKLLPHVSPKADIRHDGRLRKKADLLAVRAVRAGKLLNVRFGSGAEISERPLCVHLLENS